MAKKSGSKATGGAVRVLVATRKGLWILEGSKNRSAWTQSKPHFFGHTVNHAVADPREPQRMVAAVRAGHLGPTVFRSNDGGNTWKEAAKPPAFDTSRERQKHLAVDYTFWLTPGHASEPGVWYAGTSPPALFRSDDHGETWHGVQGFNDHARRAEWVGEGKDAPPGGATLHSINVAANDAKHLMFGVSSGGAFVSRDRGETWTPHNRGCAADFIPLPDPEFGHDVHCLRIHPTDTARVYQQNHCGIYRLDASGSRWIRIGDNMPRDVGDVGFPIVLHPRDPDTLWVFPMDGTDVWPRTSVGGKPAAYRSRDAGSTWQRQDKGMPKAQGWWTVKRQAMTCDVLDPVGLYFGTTSGEVWASFNEGGAWQLMTWHLPEVLAVETI